MLRRILLGLFIVACSSSVFAQSPLGKGGMQINGGLGFSSWGLPVYAGMDFGVHPDITIGPQVSYRRYTNKIATKYYDHSLLVLGVAGNYHFDGLLSLPSEWNVYAGISINYYSWASPSDYPDNNYRTSALGLDLQVGGRYFFSENFGINLELGGGTGTGGKIGITYIL